MITTVTSPTGPDGRAVFSVTDSRVERVTYRALDQTNGVALNASVAVNFVSPVTPVVPLRPVVSFVSPPTAAAGTRVTVFGRNLGGATDVRFGTAPATAVVVAPGGSSLTATVPPGTGTVDVVVTTPGGPSAVSPSDRFTYRP